MSNTYPRGSEWGKWDLHIHTKGTAKNDQFTSASFEDFCITLFRKAIDNRISVIGITDYFNIDNYKKVTEFVQNIDAFSKTSGTGETIFPPKEKEIIKNIFILPNVELRMMPATDSGRLINIHCLFNPDFISFIDNDFFGKISCSGGTGRTFPMNHQGMIDLGKSLEPSLNDAAAYKKGVNTFYVAPDDLRSLFDANSKFRENVVIVVSNSSKDGASALQQHYDLFEDETESQLDAVRKSIYTISQAIFSGNPEDRKYFLGEKVDNQDTVISKCGSLKPCICGSDPHSEDKLFALDGNAYCWVKANPNFEGLKQLIWDPKERVKIQERNPSDAKSGRIVIDYVTYKNSDESKKTVYLNKDLNSIIGIRGSGKSTLLKNLAYKADPSQFAERDNVERLYKLNEFKVTWGDGHENHGSDDSPKNVFYIPQNYLSSLAYDEGDKSKERDSFLTKLLKRHLKFANAIQAHEEFVSTNKIKIEGLIQTLLTANASLKDGIEQIKKQGSKKEIENEIKNKNEEIKKYRGSGVNAVTEEEVIKYSKAKKTVTDNQKMVIALKQDKEILGALGQHGANILVGNQEFSRLSYGRQETIKSELIKKGNESLSGLIKIEITKIDTEIKKFETVIVEQTKIIQELDKKIKLNKALEGITKELGELQQTSQRIDDLTKKISHDKSQKDSAISGLVSAYSDFKTQQKIIFDTVKFDDIFSSLEIETVTFYNTDDLKIFVEQNINTRDSDPEVKQEPEINTLFGDSPLQLTDEAVSKVITYLIDGKMRTRVKVSDVGEVISQLLRNRYEIDYLNSVKTKEEKTRFKDMTGGQKAIALLELIFLFDDEKYPILIDQPEDDLDVGGVATDLVKFIKSQKNERQIVVVSHNASLVVCADTEEVIVSSNGRNSISKKYDFLYETGAIEDSKVREEIIKVLEGGKEALRQRARKLNFKNEI